MISQQRVRELFDYLPTGELIWRHNGQRAGHINPKRGYALVGIDGEKHLLHRLIWLWHHDSQPTQVDHIDRDPTNNRIENLRAATAAQNSQNAGKRRQASSQWKGVSYQASKRWWRVYIQVNGRNQYLGAYRDEGVAAMVYNEAALALHGPFAVLNAADQFPDFKIPA